MFVNAGNIPAVVASPPLAARRCVCASVVAVRPTLRSPRCLSDVLWLAAPGALEAAVDAAIAGSVSPAAAVRARAWAAIVDHCTRVLAAVAVPDIDADETVESAAASAATVLRHPLSAKLFVLSLLQICGLISADGGLDGPAHRDLCVRDVAMEALTFLRDTCGLHLPAREMRPLIRMPIQEAVAVSMSSYITASCLLRSCLSDLFARLCVCVCLCVSHVQCCSGSAPQMTWVWWVKCVPSLRC